MSNIYVKASFKAFSLPVGEEEDRLLLESLQMEGCREPIYTLANDGAILDGHRRYRFCKKHDIGFKTKALRFETEQDAKNWIIDQQLARRNATEEQKSYLRGQRYLEEVKTSGRPRENTEKNDEKKGATVAPFSGKTDERLAAELGVSERTLHNDVKFAEAVNALAEVSAEAKQTILAGEAEATRSEIVKAAALPKKERKRAAKQIAAGESPTIPNGKPAEKSKTGLPDEIEAARKEFQAIISTIGQIEALLEKLRDSSAGAFLSENFKAIRNDLRNAQAGVKFAAPFKVCPYCKGKGCKSIAGEPSPCRGTGWTNRLTQGDGT